MAIWVGSTSARACAISFARDAGLRGLPAFVRAHYLLDMTEYIREDSSKPEGCVGKNDKVGP